ncbi:MAG TPA: hypothetical protein VMX17_10415 [Candidatus Glassbacteria bacterium]|nr:hypothetical protein [Candidatus Glassbacteria bacterium]
MVEEKIKQMLADGYRQLSRKYRHIGKLPKGKTGLQALREVDPSLAKSFENRMEEWATDQFLRVYGQQAGCIVTLSHEEFNEFLRQRGCYVPPEDEGER